MSDSGQNIPVTVMANDFAMRRMKQVAHVKQASIGKAGSPPPPKPPVKK